MRWPLSLALVAFAAALWWFAPRPQAARVAALEIGSVLSEPAASWPDGAAPAQVSQAQVSQAQVSLAQVLLLGAPRGDGSLPVGSGPLTLEIGGVQMSSPDEPSGDLGVHLVARRALVAALRDAARKLAPQRELALSGELNPSRAGVHFDCRFENGRLVVLARKEGAGWSAQREYQPPRNTTLLPPLLAVVLAIILRRPLLSLGAAVVLGSALDLVRGGASAGQAALSALPHAVRGVLAPQVFDLDRAMTIGFVVCMLALVGVMTASGGVAGMVALLARVAKSARSSQLATWLMGLAVFFDDYANCVLVGTTMRPLTDRFRVSREKLSYLVDSTAAPVAGISIFSTWVAFEVSTFSAQLPSAGLAASDGFKIFIATLPLRFYCWFALLLAGLIALSGRDFGPMLRAERRARSSGKLVRDGGVPMVAADALEPELAASIEPRAARAVLPLLAFVGVSMAAMFALGGAFDLPPGALWTLEGFTGVLSDGSGSKPMLIGSACALALAIAIAGSAGAGRAVIGAAWRTLRSMGVAIAILYLAWTIGSICERLGTAPYMTALIGDRVAPAMLPITLLAVSAAIAFATGTSWGTMSILLPLVPALAFHVGEDSGFGGAKLLMLCIGAVLEGSIFGDHCSPISDTSVLSSTASAADHIDHVKTQIPYALTGLAVAVLAGYFPVAYLGFSPWLCLALGALTLAALVFGLGRRSEPQSGSSVEEPRHA